MVLVVIAGDDRAGVAAGATNAALAKELLPAMERTVASIKTDDEEDVIIDRDRFPALLFVGAMIVCVFSATNFNKR